MPHDVDALNAGFAGQLLEQYLENPSSVPEEWRSLFEAADDGQVLRLQPGLVRLLERRTNGVQTAPAPADAVAAAPPAEPDEELLGGVAAAMALVKAYRTHGHLAARLDPLGSEPPGDPALEAERMEPELTLELQKRIPARLLRTYVEGETLADALPKLQETYCGTIAYELEHISDHEERVWLREAIESGRYRQPLSDAEELALLTRLTEVAGLETYLRKAFLGQKQFSIEGLDVLVPMLDEAITLAAEGGAHEAVIGMAHRGRLNVLAHVIGRPYETILREFEGERMLEAISSDSEGGTGDVKYHLGAHGRRVTPNGEINVTLAANPSHLEAVDPVVEGRTRADQTDRSTREGLHDPSVALSILIHGDAAFPAQGIVAETLNLSYLDGYATGGTLHLISNNQVGFTTEPEEGRSTRYSSDLAKGFDAPIIHVNADDPEAAIAAVRLALAFRRRFCNDVVIDLVGYRRHGHNEQDEAAYTQPLMAGRILDHPPVREQFAQRLEERGIVTGDEAGRLVSQMNTTMRTAHDRLKAAIGASTPPPAEDKPAVDVSSDVATAVAAERLRTLDALLLEVPDGFTVHPKLLRQLERRPKALDEGGIDWGQAESLAFATLVVEGIPVRLTGQDTERGTFSHRHLVLHDAKNGQRWTPIQRLPDATASFEVFNSDRDRPVHLERPLEVGRDVAADAVAAARIRRQRPGALERPRRALPPARGAEQHPHRELHDRRAVLPPPAPAGADAGRASARRADAEGPAAPEGRLVDAPGSGGGVVPSRARRPDRGAGRGDAPRPVLGKDLLRRRGARGAHRRASRRRRPARAALSVPGGRRRGARPDVPAPARDRVGPGGAAEHGPVALDPPPARGRGARSPAALRRAAVARVTVRGLPDRPSARAGPHR